MKNKRSRKGELLVETAVAMTIFVIIMAVSFRAFKSLTSISTRKREYVFFESVCLDINKYYNSLGKDYWARNYFGDYYSPTQFQLYDDHFNLIDSGEPVYGYILRYAYYQDPENNNLYDMQAVVYRYSDGYEIKYYNEGYPLDEDGYVDYTKQTGVVELNKWNVDKSIVSIDFGVSVVDARKDQDYYDQVIENNSNIPVIRIEEKEIPELDEEGNPIESEDVQEEGQNEGETTNE